MAVTKITWENKEGIQNDTSVARKNKVMDEDMNEIKQVVNNNADELGTAKDNIEDLQGGQGTVNADITSLKNRVTTLETDNTQNKSDINTLKSDNQTNKSNISTMQGQISDIQQEQQTQNTNIENNTNKNTEQDLLISKLKSALLNAETEEAKSLHITDANRFGSLEVLGNQEQKTREGYNILDYLPNIVTSRNGLTIDKDEETGYITVNGTPTANYTAIFVGSAFQLNDILEDGETYTLWQENHAKSNDSGMYLQVRIYKTSDGSEQYINSSVSNKTFTVDKSLYSYTTRIQIGTIAQAGTFTNYKNRYMIYKGTNEKEFELYGASPSPGYPSEVVCLGSNVKNIFTETNVLSDVYLNNFDEIVENQDYVMYYFEVEPNQNYVLSFKYTQNLVELGKIGYGFSDSVPFIGQELEAEDTYSIFGNKVNGKVIIPSKKYLIFSFIKSMYNTMYDIQLEKGTEATSYSPYRTR